MKNLIPYNLFEMSKISKENNIEFFEFCTEASLLFDKIFDKINFIFKKYKIENEHEEDFINDYLNKEENFYDLYNAYYRNDIIDTNVFLWYVGNSEDNSDEGYENTLNVLLKVKSNIFNILVEYEQFDQGKKKIVFSKNIDIYNGKINLDKLNKVSLNILDIELPKVLNEFIK